MPVLCSVIDARRKERSRPSAPSLEVCKTSSHRPARPSWHRGRKPSLPGPEFARLLSGFRPALPFCGATDTLGQGGGHLSRARQTNQEEKAGPKGLRSPPTHRTHKRTAVPRPPAKRASYRKLAAASDRAGVPHSSAQLTLSQGRTLSSHQTQRP